ncbi:MAG TPA: hypothetical protein VM368_04150 [Flavisolibacter sp.]|nr:hypothetical protein [Flavisolibacter sp.]
MKYIILTTVFALSVLISKAQNTVTSLPSGKYETRYKALNGKWQVGDIILMNDSQYKTSAGTDIGDYKFSVSAQRIIFTSGPLKGVYATTVHKDNVPIIVLPVAENAALNLSSEVWAYYKQ